MMNIQNWTFCYEDYEPLDCTAPCTMYSVLYDHKKIPDPFYGMNERELRHLADRDCAFETVISVNDSLLAREYAELVFHGLDIDTFPKLTASTNIVSSNPSSFFQTKCALPGTISY